MTTQEMLDRVRSYADCDVQDFDNTVGVLALNVACDKFAGDTGYPEGSYTQSVSSGTSKYNPNSTAGSWLKVKSLWFDDGGGEHKALTPTTEQELDYLHTGWYDDTGTPTHWMMVDGDTKAQLWPEPDASVTNGLITKFVKRPTTLTTSNLAASSDIPAQWHNAPVLLAAADACHKFSEDEKAAYYKNEYEKIAASARGAKTSMNARRRLMRGTGGDGAHHVHLNIPGVGIVRVF